MATTTADGRLEPGTVRASGRPAWIGFAVRPVLIVVILTALWFWVQSQTLRSSEARNLSRDLIIGQVVETVQLTAICMAITIAIGVPLGILTTVSKSRLARLTVLGLGNLGQAMPSLGLIALATIVIGIGTQTAILALVVYATLPVLRNTMVGLSEVDPVVTEAARGMGLSRRAVLLSVELPLAVPVILAGIRTALVLTVATVPLAALVDAGGLGRGLFAGLNLNLDVLSITFGVLVAVLALFFDWLGLLAEHYLRPRGIRP